MVAKECDAMGIIEKVVNGRLNYGGRMCVSMQVMMYLLNSDISRIVYIILLPLQSCEGECDVEG